MSFAKPGTETRAFLAELPRLGWARMVLFSFGMLAYVAMLRMVSSWLPKHLAPPTEALVVVDLIFFGVIFALGRFYLDAVTDPVVGHWSDHTRSRWGRRKPFILAGLFPTVLCLVALFSLHPDKLFGLWAFSDELTAVRVNASLYAVLATVYFVSSTLLAIPYLATIPEITPHPTDRKLLTGLLGILVVIGTVIGQAMPGFFPSLSQAAMVVGGVGLVSMGIVLLYFHNPPWARFGFATKGDEDDDGNGDARPQEPPTAILRQPSQEETQPPMTVREGFELFLTSLFFGLWLGLRAIFMVVTYPVWRFVLHKRVWLMRERDERGKAVPPDAGTVTVVGGGAPAPLKPLGLALRDLTQFRPFLGFIGAFVALHAAFVLMTLAVPYIPQSLLGLNAAETYHTYVTGEALDYGGDALMAALGPLPSLARDLNKEHDPEEPYLLPVSGPEQRWALVDEQAASEVLATMQAEATRVEAEHYGEALLEHGILVKRGPKEAEEWHDYVLNRLNTLGTYQASIILGVALGSTLLVGIPLILLLLTWIGKRRTCLFSLALFVTVPVLTPFVALEGVAIPGWQLIYAIGASIGVAMAGIFVLDNLLLSDVVEMDTARTGERRESLYFGIYGLLMKMGIGLATLLTASLFQVIGYAYADPWGVRLAGPVAALIALIGALAFLALYPSDARVEADVRNLNRNE